MKHTASCEAFRQIQGQAYGCTCSKPPAAAGPEPLGGPVLPGQSGVPVYDPSCPRCRAMGKRCGICMHYVEQQERRDAAGPEPMPEGWKRSESVPGGWYIYRSITLDDIRALLTTQGLAIVPAADVPSEEERAVTRETQSVPSATLDAVLGNSAHEWLKRICVAELARRAAKGNKT